MTGTKRIAAVCGRGAMTLIALAAGMMPRPALAQRGDATLRVTGPEVLVAAPDDSTGVFGSLRYSRHTGTEMLLTYNTERVSDVADEGYCRWSTDNGKRWSEPAAVYSRKKPGQDVSVELPSGRYAKCWDYSAANPFNNERIHIGTVRTLPAGANPDTPQTYWRQTGMVYALSLDDGKSFRPARPLVKEGREYSPEHPFDGLWHGKNQVYGAFEPLFLDERRFLVPLEMSVLEADGKTIYNPLGWDFSQVVVLFGRRAGDGCVWDSSQPLHADYHTQSTRGLSEPTLGRLADGRVLMVTRGSNHKKPELSSYKWASLSADEGKTWSAPVPWTYEDGSPFFSPSSMSKMVMHSSGRLFWVGNIAPDNAHAYSNGKRYPLVIGEVNRATGLLRRRTITSVADRRPGQHEGIQFSNFSCLEDRKTGEIVILVPHYYPSGRWMSGQLCRYRVEIRGSEG